MPIAKVNVCGDDREFGNEVQRLPQQVNVGIVFASSSCVYIARMERANMFMMFLPRKDRIRLTKLCGRSRCPAMYEVNMSRSCLPGSLPVSNKYTVSSIRASFHSGIHAPGLPHRFPGNIVSRDKEPPGCPFSGIRPHHRYW